MIDPFWAALVAAIPATVASGVSAYLSLRNGRKLNVAETKQVERDKKVDGRFTELLESTKAEATGAGKAEGVESERQRQESR